MLALSIIALLVFSYKKNRMSRSWQLCLACILGIICIIVHGLVDVPGQKIGIVLSGILLLGITFKPNQKNPRLVSTKTIIIYQIFSVSLFSMGLILIYAQWFNEKSILFVDNRTAIQKIEIMYQKCVDASISGQPAEAKEHLLSAIEISESALNKMPLDPTFHFIKGKLLSQLGGHDDEVKESFAIASALDPRWTGSPLRQAEAWLFIDIRETRRLWSEALKRAGKINERTLRITWEEILNQAKQNPSQIRTVHELILYKNQFSLIKNWMDIVDTKILSKQMPHIMENDTLSEATKEELMTYWKKRSPNKTP